MQHQFFMLRSGHIILVNISQAPIFVIKANTEEKQDIKREGGVMNF